MPVRYEMEGENVFRTILSGELKDEELVEYYRSLPAEALDGTWREIVDGRAVTDLAITPEAVQHLAALAARRSGAFREARVAMVAGAPVTYKMFRTLEHEGERLGHSAFVFQDVEEAKAWVTRTD